MPHAVQESGTSFKYCVSSDGAPFYGQCSPNHLANPAKTGTLADQDITGELLRHWEGAPLNAASTSQRRRLQCIDTVFRRSMTTHCDAQQLLNCCTCAQQPVLRPVLQHHEVAPPKASSSQNSLCCCSLCGLRHLI